MVESIGRLGFVIGIEGLRLGEAGGFVRNDVVGFFNGNDGCFELFLLLLMIDFGLIEFFV